MSMEYSLDSCHLNSLMCTVKDRPRKTVYLIDVGNRQLIPSTLEPKRKPSIPVPINYHSISENYHSSSDRGPWHRFYKMVTS